jgi:hypothetical protein
MNIDLPHLTPHAHPNDKYVVAAESDRGADRIYSFA